MLQAGNFGFLLLVGGAGLPELILVTAAAYTFIFGAAAIWIWALFECAIREREAGHYKVIWMLVIAFTPLVGALIYLFVRRPQRIAELGR